MSWRRARRGFPHNRRIRGQDRRMSVARDAPPRRDGENPTARRASNSSSCTFSRPLCASRAYSNSWRARSTRHGYACAAALYILVRVRVRPRINIPLLTSCTQFLRPPEPDVHVIKLMRTLYYYAQRYGRTPPSSAIGARGADGKETHVGAGEMDGSVVRAAIVSEALDDAIMD
ncbi:hypothetical protein FB451DRAFT_1179984 [Mycena latifolia]|nr:hypothetical protein FB451DRAFT_1179984 [Mycena latifolia]